MDDNLVFLSQVMHKFLKQLLLAFCCQPFPGLLGAELRMGFQVGFEIGISNGCRPGDFIG
jgi:hypothetical protein